MKPKDFKRMGGTTARGLVGTVVHELQSLVAKDLATALQTPAQVTAMLWNRLEGAWAGNSGWNIIAVPSPGSKPGNPGDFQLLIAPYYEVMTFVDAGAPARNRGGAVDQFIAALDYEQRVTDRETNELLHIETGMFMNLSNIKDNSTGDQMPIPELNIARSGTIPHGDSIMLLGRPPVLRQGRPAIPPVNSIPLDTGPDTPPGYTDPYLHADVEGLDVVNPNNNLVQDLNAMEARGLEVIDTITFSMDSSAEGGILNIPFIKKFADATRMQTVFWLERVRNKETGQEFDQLQYTQIIDIVFHEKFGAPGLITWPHITINTMVKQ